MQYDFVERGGGDHIDLGRVGDTTTSGQVFKYFHNTVNSKNNIHGEINIRLSAATRRLCMQ